MPDFQFDLYAPSTDLVIGVTPPDLVLTLAAFMRGDSGPPGPAGNIGARIEQVAVNGANTMVVPLAFNSAAHRLSINGLVQSISAYSIASQSVVLPTSLNCVAGDVLVFEYLPT